MAIELSIIVPIYNDAGNGVLNFCIDSLLNQTISNYEIILVDDCSNDDSYLIAKEYEKKFPDKIRVFKTEHNIRQGGARNIGIKNAIGKYIAFVDSDDFVSPDIYKKLIEKAHATSANRVICNHYMTDKYSFNPGYIVNKSMNGRYTGRLDNEKIKHNLLGNMTAFCFSIFLSSIVKDNNLQFPENIYYEDVIIGNVWQTYFNHVEVVDEPLYYYHKTINSTMQMITYDKINNLISASDKIIEYTKEYNIYNEYKEEFGYNSFLLIGNDAIRSTVYSLYINFFEKIKLFKSIKKAIILRNNEIIKNKYYINRFTIHKKIIVHLVEHMPTLFAIISIPLCVLRNILKIALPYSCIKKMKSVINRV